MAFRCFRAISRFSSRGYVGDIYAQGRVNKQTFFSEIRFVSDVAGTFKLWRRSIFCFDVLSHFHQRIGRKWRSQKIKFNQFLLNEINKFRKTKTLQIIVNISYFYARIQYWYKTCIFLLRYCFYDKIFMTSLLKIGNVVISACLQQTLDRWFPISSETISCHIEALAISVNLCNQGNAWTVIMSKEVRTDQRGLYDSKIRKREKLINHFAFALVVIKRWHQCQDICQKMFSRSWDIYNIYNSNITFI